MIDSLQKMRLSCMLLLGRAIAELYPSAELLGGGADEVEFYYDFSFHAPLDEQIFPLIEEKMLGWIRDDHPFIQTEMLQASAINFFDFHYRPTQAKSLAADLHEQRLVGIGRSGEFFEWIEGDLLDGAGEIGAFKLMEIQPRQEGWRIVGAVHSSRSLLKDLIKNLKTARKHHHLDYGEKLGWLERMPVSEEIVLLKKGIVRRREVVHQIESILEEGGFSSIAFLENFTTLESVAQALALRAIKSGMIYTTQLVDRENKYSTHLGLFSLPGMTSCLGVCLCTEVDLAANIKSSLKLIAKTCRILGFEIHWTLSASENRKKPARNSQNAPSEVKTPAALVFSQASLEALEELGGAVEHHSCKREKDVAVVAKVTDQLGRRWEIASLRLLSKKLMFPHLHKAGKDGKNFEEILLIEALASAERVMALELEAESRRNYG